MVHEKKSTLLGMSFGTARRRLERDLIFALAKAAGHNCFHCGGELTRETFSVEHKKAWAIAVDPKTAFFDLENVAFSYIACNQREMIGRRRLYEDISAKRRATSKRHWDRMSPERKVESRRQRYLRNGN
jgi:hypothetical protein